MLISLLPLDNAKHLKKISFYEGQLSIEEIFTNDRECKNLYIFSFTPITRQSLLRLRDSGTVCHFLNFVTEESCSETNLITLLVRSKFQTNKTTRYFNKVVSNFTTKIHLPQKLIERKTRTNYM